MLNVIDEFTHECLAIRIDRKLNGAGGKPEECKKFIMGWKHSRKSWGNCVIGIRPFPWAWRPPALPVRPAGR